MKPTILVVDDDRKTVDLIRLYLEKDGYRVLVAYDGHTAIDLARKSGQESGNAIERVRIHRGQAEPAEARERHVASRRVRSE